MVALMTSVGQAHDRTLGGAVRRSPEAIVVEHINPHPKREPWNHGGLIGPKPPLKPRHIWAIRTRLDLAHQVRDLAMFNCAIDSKLRGSDLVKLTVADVSTASGVRSRTAIVQKKTGRPVPFEITEPTRE